MVAFAFECVMKFLTVFMLIALRPSSDAQKFFTGSYKKFINIHNFDGDFDINSEIQCFNYGSSTMHANELTTFYYNFKITIPWCDCYTTDGPALIILKDAFERYFHALNDKYGYESFSITAKLQNVQPVSGNEMATMFFTTYDVNGGLINWRDTKKLKWNMEVIKNILKQMNVRTLLRFCTDEPISIKINSGKASKISDQRD